MVKTMKKVLIFLIVILFSITVVRIIDIYYLKHEDYYSEYLNKTNTLIYGASAPRGRILDKNGIILVDNVGINNVVYRLISNPYEIADKLNKIISIDEEISLDELKDYYLKTNETDDLLTEDEIKKYKRREISIDDIELIKKERINLEYSDEEINKIKIYNKLTSGYSYDTKTIATNVSDEICARVSSLQDESISCEVSWQRKYNYETLNTIYGSINKVPSEEKEYYLDNGYQINDIVGISYLEKEYENYLKGTKDIYKVNEDNTLTLISKGKRGSDLYLSIDIELQEKINEIIKNNLEKAKKMRNTKYFNRSYVIVSDPNTGAIISSSGISLIDNNFYDVTSDIINSSFTVGSVIKGASMSVGYLNNLVDVGKKINDSCVKLYYVPAKCSFKRLGYIDDIKALKMSSNYYQFLLAIKLTGNKYRPNMILNANEEHFNIYRDIFKLYGLGTTTGIDLPNEQIGIKGLTIADDLLLNLSIGQYDTYTPIQLTQYINTIALDGKRIKLSYLDRIVKDGEVILKNESEVLNTIENNRFDRIKEGFKEVLDYGGTGSGYVDKSIKAAGKTGTAEVIYDKNIKTINQSFVMFAPFDNPKYSITVISPNVSEYNEKDSYMAPINMYIAKEVSNLLFKNN